MKTIRISSLSRILGCHGSSVEPEIKVDMSIEAARVGTCVHAVCAKFVIEDLEHLPNIPEIATQHNVDIKETRILSNIALKAYRERIRPHLDLSTIMVEEELEYQISDSHKLIGHPDLMGVNHEGDTLIVPDWKSGRVESNCDGQLKGYALAGLQHYLKDYPGIKKILTIVVWLRSQTLDIKSYSLEDITVDFAHEVAHALRSDVLTPDPEYCRFCPRLDCAAKNLMRRDTVNMLVDLKKTNNGLSAKYELARQYDKIKMVEQGIKNALGLIRDLLEETGGRIQIGEGKYLGMIEKSRDEIDLVKALPFINPYVSDDPMTELDKLLRILSPALRVTKGDLLDIVGAHAPIGEKGKKKEQLMASLEEHLAVTQKLHNELNIFSTEKENE